MQGVFMNLKNVEILKNIDKYYKASGLTDEMFTRLKIIYKQKEKGKERYQLADYMGSCLFIGNLFDAYEKAMNQDKKEISCLITMSLSSKKLIELICDHYEVLSNTADLDKDLKQEFKKNESHIENIKFNLAGDLETYGLYRNLFEEK